jgi:anti-anti-sigma factor
MKLFLSYRRGDNPHATDRLVDRLVGEFGRENVFYDIDSIPIGVNWRTRITDNVSQCDVFIEVVGDNWLEELRQREATNDMVRFEIQTALKRGVPIVPVQVSHAAFPAREALPGDIADFADWNGLQLRPGLDFQTDMRRLIDRLQELAGALRTLEPRPAQNVSSSTARSLMRRSIDRLMELVGAARSPKPVPAVNVARRPARSPPDVPTEKTKISADKAQVQILTINNTHILRIQSFSNMDDCDGFYESLKAVAPDAKSRIVLDCQDIQYFTSVALSGLIRCHRYVRLSGGELRVCSLNPQPRELFRVTRVDKMIGVNETAAAAIEAFASDSRTNE